MNGPGSSDCGAAWRNSRPEFAKNYRHLPDGNLLLKNFLEGVGIV